MKRVTILGMLAACAALLMSCSTEPATPEKGIDDGNKETVTVKFVTRAAGKMSSGTKAMSDITRDDFRILAFRQATSGDWVYYGDIDTSSFTETTGNDYTIEGTAELIWGDYKFLPTYGVATTGNYRLHPFTEGQTVLTSELFITMGIMNTGMPEIFLDTEAANDPIQSLPGCSIRLDGSTTNPVTVTMTLKRAVGRVDVYLLPAERDTQGNITELPKDMQDGVFGTFENDYMQLLFTDVNTQMNVTGVPTVNDNLKMDMTYYMPTFQAGRTVIYGNDLNTGATAIDDRVGGANFANYDNIQAGSVISGGAYFVGPYLIPQQGTDAEATLTVNVKNRYDNNSLRTIEIPGNIPVKANMVTVVKVYVLSSNVYSTKAEFVVSVDTVWAGWQTVGGIVE